VVNDVVRLLIAYGAMPRGVAAVREPAVERCETSRKFLVKRCGRLADVVRVRYLLPDRADFEPCWPVLRARFGEIRPAATMLVCGLSDPRMKFEIEVYARRAR